MTEILQAVGLGLLQTVAILIGGLILGLTKNFDKKREASVLGFAAASMIGIAFFDLILEANEMGISNRFIGGGFLAGLLFMLIIGYALPNEPTRGTQARAPLRSLYKKPNFLRRWLIKRSMRKEDGGDDSNINLITELQTLAPHLRMTYTEILGYDGITLQDLARNMNLGINELEKQISDLRHHNYIREITKEGKTYYSVSREREKDTETGAEERRRVGWKTVLGFSLHDFPEGITIGAGFGANPTLGIVVALSLFVHNITEGMSIASCFKSSGATTLDILKINSIPGLLTPFGALIGFVISSHISLVHLALLLSFSAGMLVFIAMHDLLPGALMLEEQTLTTISMIAGFCIACFLFML
jgi:zinc transporter ZupT